MPILYNKKNNAFNIAGILINAGANTIENDLLEKLKKHDLVKECLKNKVFKILGDVKEAKKELKEDLKGEMKPADIEKEVENYKPTEIIGTVDESQMKKTLTKEEKKEIKKKAKELGIDLRGKNIENLIELIKEKEVNEKEVE